MEGQHKDRANILFFSNIILAYSVSFHMTNHMTFSGKSCTYPGGHARQSDAITICPVLLLYVPAGHG